MNMLRGDGSLTPLTFIITEFNVEALASDIAPLVLGERTAEKIACRQGRGPLLTNDADFGG